MKTTKIETIRLAEFPNICWVQLHTDEGLVGLGETFYGAGSVEAHVHETIAPYLLGKDPTKIQAHQPHLSGYLGFAGSGVETRARSAVDIAMWDILGQATNLPLCDLLGGRVRETIPVYNTCAGSIYAQKKPVQSSDNFGTGLSGQFEDLEAFLTRPVELAHSLLEMDIRAMKIWPFDFAAERSGGQAISAEDLKAGLKPFEQIRAALGDKMDLMAEMHSLWNRPSAIKIARALEPLELRWMEDPVFMDNMTSIGEVARNTRTPIAVGETRGMRSDFRTLLELEALSLLIMDMAWCGGVTETHAISKMAAAYHVPVSFHDCTGPVVLMASTHMALHSPNCAMQEIVRAFYYGWYSSVLTAMPPVVRGHITVPDAPGLGTALQPDLLKRADCMVRTSTL